MEKFTKITSVASPLDRINVDTDQIIPKQFLKRIERTGFGQFLFFDWRYKEDGKTPDPGFELNDPRLKGSQILIAGRNFGCGSSREHAPWALLDFGFRCLIAPSFADIFFNNCFKNGILPLKLPEDQVQALLDRAKAEDLTLTVDLESQTVTCPGFGAKFEVDAFRKHCLLNGLDDIGLTLENEDKIASFEAKRPAFL